MQAALIRPTASETAARKVADATLPAGDILREARQRKTHYQIGQYLDDTGNRTPGREIDQRVANAQ